MVEVGGITQGRPQDVPVFDVCAVAANPRVENVLERVLPKKKIAHHPHHAPEFIVGPQPTEICDCVDYFLLVSDHLEEFEGGEIVLAEEMLYFFFVFFDEVHDAFPEVFGDVLGIIFLPAQVPLLHFLAAVCLILLIFIIQR